MAIACLLLVGCSTGFRPYTCRDPLGCLDIPPGQPILIGTLLATSGEFASFGIDAQRGIELAAAQQDQIDGHDIFLYQEGTDCTEKSARAAAISLASLPHLAGVIGPICTEEVPSAAQIFSSAGLVLISPASASNPAFQGFFWAIGFGTGPDPAGTYAAVELSLKRIITLSSSSIDADRQAQTFAQSFLDAKPSSSDRSVRSYRTDNLLSILPSIAADPPDAIYLSASPVAAGLFLSSLRSTAGLEKVTVIGSRSIFSSDFLSYAGGYAVGVYLAGPDFASFGSQYQGLAAAYDQRYGEYPISSYHATGFQAAKVLFQSIAQVAVAEPSGILHIPRQGLQRAISDPGGHTGLAGSVVCSELGTCSDPATRQAVYQIIASDPNSWNPGENPKRVSP